VRIGMGREEVRLEVGGEAATENAGERSFAVRQRRELFTFFAGAPLWRACSQWENTIRVLSAESHRCLSNELLQRRIRRWIRRWPRWRRCGSGLHQPLRHCGTVAAQRDHPRLTRFFCFPHGNGLSRRRIKFTLVRSRPVNASGMLGSVGSHWAGCLGYELQALVALTGLQSLTPADVAKVTISMASHGAQVFGLTACAGAGLDSARIMVLEITIRILLLYI
jgi:hypothetical protein